MPEPTRELDMSKVLAEQAAEETAADPDDAVADKPGRTADTVDPIDQHRAQ